MIQTTILVIIVIILQVVFYNQCHKNLINLNIYPNPTFENITVDIENFNGNIRTEVFDLVGNRLQLTSEKTISLRDYSKGIYILKIVYGDRAKEVKVIKD